MKFDLKKLLISSVAVMSLLGVGASSANASHVHHHARIHRVVRHHVVRRHRGRRHVARKHVHVHASKAVRESRSLQDKVFSYQVTLDVYHDINHVRAMHHEKPLKLDSRVEKIAQKRAPQIARAYAKEAKSSRIQHDPNASEDLIHGIHNGIPVAWRYAYQQHFTYGCAENADAVEKGNFDYDGHYYSNHTPAQVAKNSVKNMMNYDADSDWGHRENILNRQSSMIGVSAYYQSNPMAHRVYGGIAEEFEK